MMYSCRFSNSAQIVQQGRGLTGAGAKLLAGTGQTAALLHDLCAVADLAAAAPGGALGHRHDEVEVDRRADSERHSAIGTAPVGTVAGSTTLRRRTAARADPSARVRRHRRAGGQRLTDLDRGVLVRVWTGRRDGQLVAAFEAAC